MPEESLVHVPPQASRQPYSMILLIGNILKYHHHDINIIL